MRSRRLLTPRSVDPGGTIIDTDPVVNIPVNHSAAERLSPDLRREQLLDHAIRAFSVRSYDEVTMASLALEAGVSKGLAFRYFSGKRELYLETSARMADEVLTASDPDPGLSAPERFRSGLKAYLAKIEEHPYALPSLAPGASSDPEVLALAQRVDETIIARMLTRMGAPAGDRLLTETVGAWLVYVRASTHAWMQQGRELPREELVSLQIGAFRGSIEAALRLGAAPGVRLALP